MRRVARARIKWLTRQDGGRKEPPQSGKYSTVVRFENDKENWPQSAWSLVADLSKAEYMDEPLEIIAPVWLLAHDDPKAPNYLLRPNSRFELLEGHRIVAKGEILDLV